ncbi:hypothetical protein GQ457_11G004850 [Hibiscus cannabinus]
MVWVRLPRLSYRYYTKSIFRHITGILGTVVRIDYNTDVASRGRFSRLAVIVDLDKPLITGIIIDGQRQPVEYEGLPSICYGCGKYGHSKEVCGQSGQKSVEDRVHDGMELNKENLYGPWMQVTNPLSQFHEHDIIGDDDHNGIDVVTDQTRRVLGSTLARGKAITPPHAESSKVRESDDAVLQNGIPSPQKLESCGGTSGCAGGLGAEWEDFALFDNRKWRNKGQGSGAGVLKKGVRTKKRDPRSTSRVSLAGLVENLVIELDTAQSNIVQQVSDLSDSLNGVVEAVQWRENTAFDPGALDPVFNRYFKLYMNLHQPDMFVVMEPRISGSKADAFIRRSRFDSSFRVEAMGFFGGIWVMWSNLVSFEVLAVSNYFIHGLVTVLSSRQKFFFTFVYASPHASQRQAIWNQLYALDPGRGLVDMGYNGPTFTWKRGNLSQRLDRGICNDAWYDLFPNSEVFHLQRLGSDHCPVMIDTICQRNAGFSRPFRFLFAWNNHSDFQSMLKASWNTNSSMGDNIARFQHNSRPYWSEQKPLIWVSVLKHKYKWRVILLDSLYNGNCSRLWRGLTTVWPLLRNSLCWNIRNGQLTDFWHDNWLNFDNPLAHICEFASPPAPAPVASFVCSCDDPEWPVRFVVFCWLLWKRRCGLLLDDGYVDRGDLVAHGLKIASDFTDGMKSEGVSHNLGTVVAPTWTCPRPGWVKINADGAVDPRDGDAAAGGVIGMTGAIG